MNLDRKNCPIVKSMSEIGDKWMLLILRELFLGSSRFDEFQKNLQISKSVLTGKLKLMLEKQLIEKVAYKKEQERIRYEYALTRKGKDLFKVIVAFMEWGNKYMVESGEETMEFIDKTSQEPIKLSVLDYQEEKLRWRNVRLVEKVK